MVNVPETPQAWALLHSSEYEGTQNNSFASCFVLILNVVSNFEGRTETVRI